MSNIDKQSLLDRFLTYVQIDSETGEEKLMSDRLFADLQELGFEVTKDDIAEVANTTGYNVYATLPGDSSLEPIMFSAHMDTVIPGKGIKPRVCDDGFVRAGGDTILGADDKAGICAIIEAMRAAAHIPHRTVEAVFTIREESGLIGAKCADFSRIKSKKGVILDSSAGPNIIMKGAPGSVGITATVHGKKAHAGVAPEKGISAIQVASHGIAAMNLLRIDEETTCNIGVFSAEFPTNIVADRADLKFEVRSRDNDKLKNQTQHIIDCLKNACDKFGATLEHEVKTSYTAYMHDENHPLIVEIKQASEKLGLVPELKLSGGGSDANIFNQHGIESLTIGVGMDKVHTVDEQLCIAEMEKAAEVCLELMKA